MWEAKLEFKAPTQSFSSKLWKSSEQLFLENLLMTVSEFYLCVCVCVCVCVKAYQWKYILVLQLVVSDEGKCWTFSSQFFLNTSTAP